MVPVLIAIGVKLYRSGLQLALRGSDVIEVVGTIDHTGDPSLAHRAERAGAAVLLDVATEGGVAVLAALTAAAPDVLVVALGVSDSTTEILRCAEAGASGYVTRDASVADLEAVIAGVARGEFVCSPQVASALLRRVGSLAGERRRDPPAGGPGTLSRRELEIVALIDRGLSNKQIATRLFITQATVKNHVHHILEKLGVSGRHEAAASVRGGRVTGGVLPRPAGRARSRMAVTASGTHAVDDGQDHVG